MSARGEGAGQPSTSAQGQPAAPAPQKRGRGRPRKQQQVSTRAGWEPQPTFAPSARPPAGGGLRSPVRGWAGTPAPLRAGRRGAGPGGGRWGLGQRVLGLSLLCTARSVAGAPGDGKRPGSDLPGLADAFLTALQLPRGKEVRGARMLWKGSVGGAGVPGAVRGLFLPPSRAASGPGSARRSRPFGAFPKCLVAGDSRPPDKERVGRPVLSLLFKCGGAAEVSRGRGYRRVWVRKGRD